MSIADQADQGQPHRAPHRDAWCEVCAVNQPEPGSWCLHCKKVLCLYCAQTDAQGETTCPACLAQSESATYQF
jgi:hypothetical protein